VRAGQTTCASWQDNRQGESNMAEKSYQDRDVLDKLGIKHEHFF
jgi:hypothetical protein